MNVRVKLPVKKDGRFVLTNGTILKVPLEVLERCAKLAASDPKRVDGDVVEVSACWLIGERIGY